MHAWHQVQLTHCCMHCTNDGPQNKMKINDWSAIQSLFDDLNKRLDKIQKTEMTSIVPRAYVKLLVELEDFLNETLANKDVKKKMSPTNAKALNTMRQRLKKHNVMYTEMMNAFRENPESPEVSSSEEEQQEGSGDEEAGSGDEVWETKTKEKKKDKLLTMDPKGTSTSCACMHVVKATSQAVKISGRAACCILICTICT